ncbi:MAG: flagellar export chaperone FlgN [Selenomonadaceae bacterium]|nr:flagellar export chaperone FlgN [Selenomonadaceae bacterium]
MDKVIKLLREQMILCSRLSEIFNNLSDAFKEARSGFDVTSSVQKVEPLMRDLSKNDSVISEFLKTMSVDNMKTFIEMQPAGVERDVANRLLNQVGELQKRLRHQITNVARLMTNSKKFIDFNINVMSQTVADDIYSSGRELGQHQRHRVFDAHA